jgi:hypothetical protein
MITKLISANSKYSCLFYETLINHPQAFDMLLATETFSLECYGTLSKWTGLAFKFAY